MSSITEKHKQFTPESLTETVNKNQCEYPNPVECPKYIEVFHCCAAPSCRCDYRKKTNSN